MFKLTNEFEGRLAQFKKSDMALRKTFAKRHKELDASQNTLRVGEQAIGVKLFEKKLRS